MKILLIAGHGAGDPGACSSYGIERDETRRVVAELKNQFGGYNVNVDVYPTNRNAYADVCNGCLQVNFANYDYVFEVHFNSAASNAYGTEIWVTTSEAGISVEQTVVNKLASIGYVNRGVKREDFCVIRTAKRAGTSSALVEVCFISNKEDMDRYYKNFSKICSAMVDGITQGFGISKKNGYVGPATTSTKQSTSTSINVSYRVKTKDGKQLGAFNSIDNAKKVAESNKAIVYDKNNNVVVSYVPTPGLGYLNLKPHMQSWRVYAVDGPYTTNYAVGALAPAQFGGLSYEILEKKATDVYKIKTSSFGVVAIYAPRDNDSSITSAPVY